MWRYGGTAIGFLVGGGAGKGQRTFYVILPQQFPPNSNITNTGMKQIVLLCRDLKVGGYRDGSAGVVGSRAQEEYW
jgi:hypothetical protein